MPGMSRNAKAKILAAKKDIVYLKDREAGMTYDAIGKKHGVSGVMAFRRVSRAFDKLVASRNEKASHVLRRELDRLDTMHKALWKRCKEGDTKAIQTLLRTMEHRSRLLGLEVQKHEVKVEQSYEVNVTARIDEYAAELERLGTRRNSLPSGAQGNGRRKPVDEAGSDL